MMTRTYVTSLRYLSTEKTHQSLSFERKNVALKNIYIYVVKQKRKHIIKN